MDFSILFPGLLCTVFAIIGGVIGWFLYDRLNGAPNRPPAPKPPIIDVSSLRDPVVAALREIITGKLIAVVRHELGSLDFPKVMVTVPPDWKALTPMPITELEGARAALWYTAFVEATKNSDINTDECADIANSAVRVCFGEVS